MYKVMKVAATSEPPKVAGAFAQLIRSYEASHAKQIERAIAAGTALPKEIGAYGELLCIGASSINAGIKAAAIVKSMVVASGYKTLVDPCFVDVDVKGKMKTAMRLIIVKDNR